MNTVELLPIHEFDEFEFQRQVNPRNHMVSLKGWYPLRVRIPAASQHQKPHGEPMKGCYLTLWSLRLIQCTPNRLCHHADNQCGGDGLEAWLGVPLGCVQLNTWGYSTINFFAPMMRYGSGGKGPVEASRELKNMIKTLHAAGIEVRPRSWPCFKWL